MIRLLHVSVLAVIACAAIGWALILYNGGSGFAYFLFDYGSLASCILPCLLGPALMLRERVDELRITATFFLTVVSVGCFIAWLATELIMTGGAGSPRFVSLLGPAAIISLLINSLAAGAAMILRKLGLRLR